MKHIEISDETHQRLMMSKAKLSKRRAEDVIVKGLELIEDQLFE